MMLRSDIRALSVKSALTVLATVFVCVAILFVLQPWPSNADLQREAPVTAVAAVSGADAKSDQHATLVAATPDMVSQWKSEPSGVLRVAKRNAEHVPVPTPAEDDAIALPPKKEELSGEPASEPSAPQQTAIAPSGTLSKTNADAALASLLAYKAPDGDIDALKDIIKLTYGGEFSKAGKLADKLSDPAAIKFAQWYSYRRKAPNTSAAKLIEFLEENPEWPNRDLVEETIEDALFWREDEPKRIIDYFAGKRPISGTGLAALGIALIAEDKIEEGSEQLREAWRKHPLTPAIEKKIRKLKVLKNEDHRARVDYLLMQDNRRYVAAVERILPNIDKKWRDSVKARIATVKRAKNAGTLLTRLDKSVKHDPAVLFARIQWLRRADRDKKVWSLLRSAPKDAEKLVDPEEWWKEREIQVRLALNDGKPKTAYAIAKDHGGGLEHWDLSDAEFLAGWIALRFLNKPDAAREHFLAAAAAGGLPKRRARAGYWLGRTELELKNDRAAIARFAEAAQHFHTFYGQLAHQMIATTGAKVAFRTFVRPSEREIEDFANQDVFKAIVIAKNAGFENLISVFLYDLARNIESAPQMILLCELALRVAPRHQAVRMAKIAMNRDFPVEHYAYPDALPDFKALGDGAEIEHALLHALTRQESEFNPGIVSSAGAVGLMQLLPSTAKMVARSHKLKYSKKKLSSDPAYNVSLGTAFLHRLISNYDGSYMMALAGYNAGPGRVRQWVRQFGDPREKKVDPIDWIERIPFNETRNYVHKILESAQVYRSRLQGDHAPLQLAEDLHRGREDKPRFMTSAAAN